MRQVFADAGVGEGDVRKRDMRRFRLRFVRRRARFEVLFKLQYVRHAQRGCLRARRHDEDTRNAEHGVQNHDEVLQKRDDDRSAGRSAEHAVRADHDDRRQTEVQHQRGDGIVDRRHGARLRVGGAQCLVDAGEPLALIVRLAQRLDDAHAGHVLLHHAHHVVELALLLRIERNALFRDDPHGQRDDRQQRDKHERQLRVHRQHHKDAADQQDRSADAEPLPAGKEFVDAIGVAREPRFGGRQRELVHLSRGQRVQLFKEIETNLPRDLAGALRRHAVRRDVQRKADGGAQQHRAAVNQDAVLLSGNHAFAQDAFHKIRHKKLSDSAAELNQHGESDIENVRPDICPELSHNAP